MPAVPTPLEGRSRASTMIVRARPVVIVPEQHEVTDTVIVQAPAAIASDPFVVVPAPRDRRPTIN